MAKKSEELLQLLFPEYQIRACVKECGFIAKKNESISQNAQTVRRKVNTYTPSKEDKKIVNKTNDAFDGLSEELKKYWIGTENDRNAVCKAFRRPFIRGFDNVKPKNTKHYDRKRKRVRTSQEGLSHNSERKTD